ncbi:DUF262 domain-containing protein [Streptomyces sp. NBC_00320]|uniref:DUF262 domain-containing protein n=1 Tax=Streptomyces sp. NBC_00320 TaxID=2975711 RepID=UPI00224E8FBF|nr:DUF262 domain-containing protein [Streptomyces sp. NBC_00320]MCX5146378.1 DUF262 domain-containing protein [Streptomyces sp. NBC_00320]
MTDLDDVVDESGEDETDLVARDDDEAATTTVDWTVETVVSQMRKGRIDLTPSFQRRDAWTRVAKSRYIESLIQRYPVPQIVLAEDPLRPGRYLVIDGKQRLLSIRQFCADADDSRDASWMDDKLRLTGLTEAKKLNGSTYEKLDSDFPAESMRLENATIRAVLLRKWHSNDFLYTVFYRLNSGSLKLSPQELRQALYPGPFMDYVDKASGESQPLQWLLNKTRPDRRMVDAELMLRFIAFQVGAKKYEGNLKNFLDGTAESMTKRWDSEAKQSAVAAGNAMNEAISAARSVFERDACRKFVGTRFERSLNRALFDVQIHYFADPALREWQLQNKPETVSAFQELCRSDAKFIEAVTSTTKTVAAVVKRYTAWGDALSQVSGVDHQLPAAIATPGR